MLMRIIPGHPTWPMNPVEVPQGSALPVTVEGVPRRDTAVTLEVVGSDGATTSYALARQGNVWTGVIPATQFAAVYTATNGITVKGTLDDGNVETLGAAKLTVGEGGSDVTPVELPWANVTGKPDTFPPAAHTHAAADVETTGATSGQVLKVVDGVAAWANESGGGGGGGTTDYGDLSNKPSIGGVTLEGNKSVADIGAAAAAHTHIPADIDGYEESIITIKNTLNDKMDASAVEPAINAFITSRVASLDPATSTIEDIIKALKGE